LQILTSENLAKGRRKTCWIIANLGKFCEEALGGAKKPELAQFGCPHIEF
jgi:hypothetical protein